MGKKLKIKTINMASVLLGLAAALVILSFGLISRMWLVYVILGVAIGFGLVYLASRLVIKKFFVYKIKPIYQIITGKNITSRQLVEKHANKDNLVEDVREELNLWADKNSEEIARLKDNERYRKEFLGNVSHEIKTPIFTIQGYILTLLDGALEEPGINRLYLERTEKNIDRLINILNDLDEISKLEIGDINLHFTNFDIVALARDIVDSVELDAEKSGISLKINAAAALSYMVYADKSQISQVLVNLITNSIKYGKQGGITKINFIDMIDKVIVEVQDDGIGISKEHQVRIFERFYRVDKSRSREQGGTGLGLAIVKHIMEAHGEKVSMRSEQGVGTTFSFSLTKNTGTEGKS